MSFAEGTFLGSSRNDARFRILQRQIYSPAIAHGREDRLMRQLATAILHRLIVLLWCLHLVKTPSCNAAYFWQVRTGCGAENASGFSRDTANIDTK